MENPFLNAFDRLDLANVDPTLMSIHVRDGEKVVGEIALERPGTHEMGYAYHYHGVTRGPSGVTPIGPTFDVEAMKRRIVSVMFNGDEAAFRRSVLIARRKTA